jgi:putative flippase GtrA
MDEFLAQVISTIIGVIIAFATQKYFTFKHDTAA